MGRTPGHPLPPTRRLAAERIGPSPGTTPVAAERKPLRALPPDLLRDASRRLGITALLLAGLWVAGAMLRHVALMVDVNDPAPPRFDFVDGITGVVCAASLAIVLYTRTTRKSPTFVLDLGLGYLVLIGAAIALIINWAPVPPHASVLPMISPIGPIMLVFAAIVPNTPVRGAIAGLIAVSMNPVSMIVARARGTWDFGPTSHALLMHAPDYVLVVAASVIAHVVTRLGQQVANARELGSYQLGELLGRGGMGEVYRATHRLLARPAAIKLVRPEMIGAGTTEEARMALLRFRREAEVVARLRSPHTVALFDFGITEDRTFYLVMELLDGLDLESLVQQEGPLPPPRAVHVLRQVCESLEEAHAIGLVHRDIKPANIHLGRVGLRHDFVKVLDFGIVKSVAESDVTQTQPTTEGLALGTPGYMAPEMALGAPLDGRADIYALGCVAYYLLTGRPVFAGSKGLQILVKRLTEDPPPLSSASASAIPAALERAVMECLARDPADRPTAGELSRSLSAVRLNAWTNEDAARWWQSRERLAATARK
jgi:serine/threonine-protein kinase